MIKNKQILDLREKNERILELMEHFYPGSMSYGGHPIWVKAEDVKIIKKEFSKALKIVKSDGGFKAMSLPKPKWPSEYVIELLTYGRNLYREEASKYYDGMRALLD